MRENVAWIEHLVRTEDGTGDNTVSVEWEKKCHRRKGVIRGYKGTYMYGRRKGVPDCTVYKVGHAKLGMAITKGLFRVEQRIFDPMRGI